MRVIIYTYMYNVNYILFHNNSFNGKAFILSISLRTILHNFTNNIYIKFEVTLKFEAYNLHSRERTYVILEEIVRENTLLYI